MQRSKTSLAGRLALLVVLALPPGAARAGGSASELVKRWMTAEHAATFRAVGQGEEQQTDGETVSVGIEMRRRAGAELIKVVSGPAFYQGAQISDRGTRSAVWLPSEHRVYEWESAGRQSFSQHLQTIEHASHGDARDLGEETVCGRATRHLTVTSRRSDSVLEAWVDSEQMVALKLSLRHGDRVWRSYSFENVNFAPGLSDGDLDPDAPSSAAVVSLAAGKRGDPVRLGTPAELRAQTGLRSMIPSWLPDGFRFDTILLSPPQQVPNLFRRRVMVRYIKGNRVLVLLMGANAPKAERESGEPEAPTTPTEVKPGVFFWVKANVRLALIGPRDTSSDDLKRCANSVEWYDKDG